jgi:hypothetical protein
MGSLPQKLRKDICGVDSPVLVNFRVGKLKIIGSTTPWNSYVLSNSYPIRVPILMPYSFVIGYLYHPYIHYHPYDDVI